MKEENKTKGISELVKEKMKYGKSAYDTPYDGAHVIIVDEGDHTKRWTNQTQGWMCNHPEMDGYLVEVGDELDSGLVKLGEQSRDLDELFLTPERLVRLRGILTKNKLFKSLFGEDLTFHVMGEDNWKPTEAWLPFSYTDRLGERRKAILTYSNSD